MSVHSRLRGCGIGSRLLDACVARARTQQQCELMTHTAHTMFDTNDW
ncbi:MAG: GNAT family N-acetyltransferase, partial [Rhodanobacteraceae bacterium]|nr:GNAT family N-acetyltransferase [Rhodanobacteraceae bacterium]